MFLKTLHESLSDIQQYEFVDLLENMEEGIQGIVQKFLDENYTTTGVRYSGYMAYITLGKVNISGGTLKNGKMDETLMAALKKGKIQNLEIERYGNDCEAASLELRIRVPSSTDSEDKTPENGESARDVLFESNSVWEDGVLVSMPKAVDFQNLMESEDVGSEVETKEFPHLLKLSHIRREHLVESTTDETLKAQMRQYLDSQN